MELGQLVGLDDLIASLARCVLFRRAHDLAVCLTASTLHGLCWWCDSRVESTLTHTAPRLCCLLPGFIKPLGQRVPPHLLSGRSVIFASTFYALESSSLAYGNARTNVRVYLCACRLCAVLMGQIVVFDDEDAIPLANIHTKNVAPCP